MHFTSLLLLSGALLMASPAMAKEISCGVVSVDIPDNWVTISEPETDKDSLSTASFGQPDRKAAISLISGPNDGMSTKEVAENLAPSVHATEKPSEHDGQFGFATESNGVQGFCVVSSDSSQFFLACMQGDVSISAKILQTMKSSKHPALVIK